MLDFLFGRKPAKAQLQDLKTLRLGGGRYVIRRINPILDFPGDRMPTVFSSYSSGRKVDPAKASAQMSPARQLEEMMMVVSAGLVEPALVPAGKGEAKGREDGITIEDLFRDPSHGAELYVEIMAHSLNRFSGLRKIFFSLQIKRLRSIASLSIMDAVRAA